MNLNPFGELDAKLLEAENEQFADWKRRIYKAASAYTPDCTASQVAAPAIVAYLDACELMAIKP